MQRCNSRPTPQLTRILTHPGGSWWRSSASSSRAMSRIGMDWMLQAFGYSNKSNIFLCFLSSPSTSTAIWVQSTTIIILVVHSLTWTDEPEKITTRQHPLKSKQWRWQPSLIYKRAMSWSLATKLHAMMTHLIHIIMIVLRLRPGTTGCWIC